MIKSSKALAQEMRKPCWKPCCGMRHMAGRLTLRLPSAMMRRRLQSAQKALVMEVMKDTLPLKPGTRKFLATSPLGSCRQPHDPQLTRSSLYTAQRFPLYSRHFAGMCVLQQWTS